MADAAGRKGFSGRLMGMKFMQRAALKLGKRKADDALSAAAPSDASSPPAPPEAPDTAPDTAPETAPDVTVLLHRGKTRCRVIVQASVHEGQAQLLAGRKSFAQGADEVCNADQQARMMLLTAAVTTVLVCECVSPSSTSSRTRQRTARPTRCQALRPRTTRQLLNHQHKLMKAHQPKSGGACHSC